MQAQLAERAKELQIDDHVHFIGNQNQQALAQLNAHAAVVLSPLTGRALSEAALGAAAIVAYDLDWQRDLIESGKTGELVPFRRPDLLGAAAIRLLEYPQYAASMGAAVRARALTILDPESLNEHERQEYAKVMRMFRRGGTA